MNIPRLERHLAESRCAYTPPLGTEREQERMIQGLLAPDTLLDVLRSCSFSWTPIPGSG